MRLKYELVPVRQGYFILKATKTIKKFTSFWTKDKIVVKEYIFGIEDYHMSGDYTGPMKFKSGDAKKVQRFLNHYHNGSENIAHWKIYDRMKRQLKLTTGLYAG